jgi:competence protein ComEA
MDHVEADRADDLTRPPLRTPTALGSWIDERLGRVRLPPVGTVVALLAGVLAAAAVGWTVLTGRLATGTSGSPLPKVAEVATPPPTGTTAAEIGGPDTVAGGAAADAASPSAAAPDDSGPSQAGGSGAGGGGGGGPPDTVLAEVHVHVAGAVRVSGLYRLPPGARVADAVDAAGGLLADAAADRINLAALVADGEQVYVPRTGEPERPAVAGGASPAGGGGNAPGRATADPAALLDVNTATPEQLEALPGIGPSIAAAIVRHRDGIGPFSTVDDLADVPGIGPAKLDAIRELVTT